MCVEGVGVRVCVCDGGMRACVRACARARVCACVCVCVIFRFFLLFSSLFVCLLLLFAVVFLLWGVNSHYSIQAVKAKSACVYGLVCTKGS